MQDPKRLYLLFSFLGMIVAGLVFGIYHFISVPPPQDISLSEDAFPKDWKRVLNEVSDKESWIYRMHLHQKQNVFSYPRTVYHINLN